MIWAQLYVQDEPIVLKRDGHSKRFTGLPLDPYKYLSRQFVGRAVSQEVARVFYGQNTFALDEDIQLERIVDQDFYRSSATPRKFLKKLVLSFNDLSNNHELPTNREYVETESLTGSSSRPYW